MDEREREREREREKGERERLHSRFYVFVLLSLMSLLLGTILVCDYATMSFPCHSNLFFGLEKNSKTRMF